MITGIYKIENLINHKIYIGKALDIHKRWKDHQRISNYKNQPWTDYPLYRAMRKYGIEQFNFSIIETCLPDELNDKEQYWISYYKAFGPQGYNQNIGGDGNSKLDYKIAIQLYNNGLSIKEISDYFNVSIQTTTTLLHQYKLGYLTQEEKDKLQNPRPVSQYDLNGKFISNYYSAGDAARKLNYKNFLTTRNSILKACNNYCTAYQYLWKYTDDTIDMITIANKIKEGKKQRLQHVSIATLKRCSKPVNQYDLAGKYIKSYNSASEARRAINNQHISDVCNGKWLTAAGYYWRYISDEFPQNQDLNVQNITQWRKLKAVEAANGT